MVGTLPHHGAFSDEGGAHLTLPGGANYRIRRERACQCSVFDATRQSSPEYPCRTTHLLHQCFRSRPAAGEIGMTVVLDVPARVLSPAARAGTRRLPGNTRAIVASGCSAATRWSTSHTKWSGWAAWGCVRTWRCWKAPHPRTSCSCNSCRPCRRDQTEADHARLVAAVDRGALPVEHGI
jgi:hypothetical protein